MGFLTTFTIYNDSSDQIKKNADQLAEEIYNACLGVQINRGYNWAPLGNHTNALTLQKPRHADDHTLYMHAGNTVIDVYSLNENSKWGIDEFINEMEYHLKRLKELKNNKKMASLKK